MAMSHLRAEPAATKREVLVAHLVRLCHETSPGNAIPSERELAQQHGVSRMTMRAAIDELVQDGYLIRRHGSGTFVSRPKIAKQVHLTSFTDDMRSRGLEASTRVLSMRKHPAGARIGALLRVSPDELVLTAGRLRLADGEPMALEWLSIPEHLVPGLARADLDSSFYALLRERYAIVLEGGQQTVEATVTDEDQSRLLEVPLHTPALAVERVTWAARDQRVELVHSLYRGDRYRFGMDLVRPRVSPVNPNG